MIASALTGLIQAPGASAASTRGPSILDPPEIARGAPTGMHGPGQSRQAPEAPPSTNAPYTVGYLPISRLVTEDVDLVEVAAASGTILGVWPTEGAVHFIDIAPVGIPGFLLTSEPTSSPNITGVDFVANAAGSMGAFASLGSLYLYDLTPAIPTTVAQTQLPGTPARRDIDPIIVGGGSHVIYATGTEIHCIAYPSGAIVWTLPLPSPVVEAVDPVVTKVEDRLIVPTEGYVTIYDISLINAPVFLSSYFLGTTLVREVDARLAAGDALCYMPAKGGLFVFSTASGMQITTIPLQSPLIEGNDMEIDPTGTYGFLPTLAWMYQVDLAAISVPAVHSFTGFVHQRNQDAVFTNPPGGGPWYALYAVQGAVIMYDVFGLGIVSVFPTPGTLIDGVDPAVTDTAPWGEVVTLSTLGYTHVITVPAGAVTTMATPGQLRLDVDSKPGPQPTNKILQPTIGGIMSVEGFGPDEWIVSTATGLWTVDIATLTPIAFLASPGLMYRGGDAQPSFLLPGPGPEPPFSVDNPDQDFITKCWEYKFAFNRWPYWYSTIPWGPIDYPNWIPFGYFGPPALVGYDRLSHVKAVLVAPEAGPTALVLLDEDGVGFQQIVLPEQPIGGIVWDTDNSHCMVRMQGQLELNVDLSTIPSTGLASFDFIPYGSYCRWFPIVDRMNGWHFMVLRGGYDVWVYDHLYGGLVDIVHLDGRILRRPEFDAQRKTLCLPLTDRRVCFLSAWKLRYLMPQYLYYSPVLPAHIVSAPIFDYYNHHTIFKLWGGRLVVLNTDTADLVWDSGILPYWPISRFRVDCYNKTGKGYFRDPYYNYYEMYLNLYPLAWGMPPVLKWLPLTGRPWGYPWFDSRDGYEFMRIGYDQVPFYSIWQPVGGGVIVAPGAILGNLFFDRVNKYCLFRIEDPTGVAPSSLYWMDLFRVTNDLPDATHVIEYAAGFEEDIVFDTQGHYATVHTSDGRFALIDMQEGVLTHVASPGYPRLDRQLYGHPFRQLVNYPFNDPVFGGAGELTLNLSPLRWDPPGPPYAMALLMDPPIEATDFTPPDPVDAALIVPVGLLPGDSVGVHSFELQPGAVEPGAVVQVWNATTLGEPEMDEPTEMVAEEDGSGAVTVVAGPGDLICFMPFDAAGNAAPEVCLEVPVVSVPQQAGAAFAFAMLGDNPVRETARFALTLPADCKARLVIYDVAGRAVRTLLNEPLAAGTHDLVWDLAAGNRSVPAGVYFARLLAGADERSMRIVVVR